MVTKAQEVVSEMRAGLKQKIAPAAARETY
jgi:hypothetical protein